MKQQMIQNLQQLLQHQGESTYIEAKALLEKYDQEEATKEMVSEISKFVLQELENLNQLGNDVMFESMESVRAAKIIRER